MPHLTVACTDFKEAANIRWLWTPLKSKRGLPDNQLQILTKGGKRFKSHRCLEGIINVMDFTDK